MGLQIKTHKQMPRGCAVLIGLVFFLAGLAGLIVLWNTLISTNLRIRAWAPVPCTVTKAETVTKGRDLKGNLQMDVEAELAWEWKGTRYTGGKLDADTGFHAAESLNSKEEVCYNLRQHPQQTCYVNPDNPAEAILRLPEWWPALMATGFAVLFMIIGSAVILSFRKGRAAKKSASPGCLALGFVLLLGVAVTGGAVALWWFVIRNGPDWDTIGARMKEVPCTVVSSTISESQSGTGTNRSTTYRANIVFRYEWDGRTWHSEWENFNKNSASSSNRRAAAETVRRFAPDTPHSCWVDPQQPWVAVLEKTGAAFGWMWVPAVLLFLLGGFFLVLALIKLAVIVFALKRRDNGSGPGSSEPPALPPSPPPIPE